MIFEGTKNQFFFGLELTRAGNRNAPDYVLRLLAYYIRMENMVKEKEKKYGEDN